MKKEWILTFGISVIAAFEALMIVDAVAVFFWKALSLKLAAGVFLCLLLLFSILFLGKRKKILVFTIVLPTVLGLVSAAGVAGWRAFGENGAYLDADAGKNKIYGDRKVMVIVPHQDDELNILGGVLEEYVRYGSSVYPVFVTNGDGVGLAEARHREALAVMGRIGVPEENVIFLGYGDTWKAGGPHLYNAVPGETMESLIGKTETYGSQVHAAYREGRAYTIDNLTEDLETVILEYRPEVIFCSDYDHHIDHKATTLLFDKVMGRILKENPEYVPVVYKAYAYGTAWEADTDFYNDNILATRNLFAEPYGQKPAVYRWEDRVRFPVQGMGLSRSLVGTEGFALLSLHDSQGAGLMAESVVNGDKVAWQRYTDSLCLHADVQTTSSDAALLNDFMLIENHNLTDEKHAPFDGVWIPEQEDKEKTAVVTLKEPSDISCIVLYDHPSGEENICNAWITFDDGTVVETGPLDPGGAATVIPVDRKNVSSFSVALQETQGTLAGLTEIEAFEQMPTRDGTFLKLMDAEENFAYDYWTGRDGNVRFQIYTHGDLPNQTGKNYRVETVGDSGTAVYEDGAVRVYCPVGERVTVTVAWDALGISDTVTVRNPGVPERVWTNLWQAVEQAFFARYRVNAQDRLLISRLVEKAARVLPALL